MLRQNEFVHDNTTVSYSLLVSRSLIVLSSQSQYVMSTANNNYTLPPVFVSTLDVPIL